MTVLGMKLADFVAGLIGLGLAFAVAYRWFKEFRARKRGLSPNPRRCKEHEDKIADLNTKWAVVVARLDSIDDKAEKLLDLHLSK